MKAILIITYILNCVAFLAMFTFGFVPRKYKKLNKVLSFLVVLLTMGLNTYVIISFNFIWCLL